MKEAQGAGIASFACILGVRGWFSDVHVLLDTVIHLSVDNRDVGS